MSKVGFKKREEPLTINNDATVKVTRMGHIIEVLHLASTPHMLDQYQKVDKDHYIITDRIVDIEKHTFTDTKTGEDRLFAVDKNTGEVLTLLKYERTENRSQNMAGIKKTMKKIRDIINNNFIGAKNELFITLTYEFVDGKPMNDVKKASRDFDAFIKRFRRRYPDLEYVAVLEPQGNTAWHWHILVMFKKWDSNKQIRIDNNTVLEPLWGHGFTKVKALTNVDNIGAYLGGYLGDVEVTDENKEDIFDNVLNNGDNFEVIEKEVAGEDDKKTSKRFLKGARLHLYPSGTNIYRCSKGIVKPTPEIMTYAEAKQIIGSKEPDFARTVQIVSDKKNEDGEARVYNSVTYESYNLKRRKKPPVE